MITPCIKLAVQQGALAETSPRSASATTAKESTANRVPPGKGSQTEPFLNSSASGNPTEDETISDAQLVRQAKAGELAAFELLVKRHERVVYSLARRMLQNEQDAEDVTQQAFLSAVEHLADFREQASFKTWLLRIATHAALKVIRKRKGLNTVSLEGATEASDSLDSIPHPEFIADWSLSPEQLVHNNEARLLLNEALARLDEKQRLVFLLRDVEGMSIKEAASALALSEADVKISLLRARLHLRELLTRTLGDPKTRIDPPYHRHA